MLFFRLLRRRVVPLLSVILLAGALMPLLAQAFGAATGKDLIEVCTTQGTRWLSASSDLGDDPASDGTLTGTMSHCPFCSLGGHGPTLPAKPQVACLPADVAVRLFPERHDSAGHTLHVWCTAQPRAPPTSA